MRIVFSGVGALGSTAAVACRNLDATLRLVDFDRVESKNLLAQAYTKPSIGKNKAAALKLQLANFWGVTAEAFGVRLTDQNAVELLGGADLIVDAFDNIASRKILSNFSRTRGTPCVHGALAADGTFGLVRWDERFAPDPENAEGQATCEGGEHLPMIAVVGATLARAIQDFAKDRAKHDYMISLSGVQRT
jgi:molybdopterin/thiamine biosynthesis adenylyltransferase